MITLKSENGRYIVTIGSEKKAFVKWSAAIKYIGNCREKETVRDE